MTRFAALLLLTGCPDYGEALCAPCEGTCPYELSCVSGRCVSEVERCSTQRLCTSRLGTRHVPLELLVTYDAGNHVLGRGNAGVSEAENIVVEPIGSQPGLFPIQPSGLFEFDVDSTTDLAIRFANESGESCGPKDVVSVRPRSIRDSECRTCANGFLGCGYADEIPCASVPDADECVNDTDCVTPKIEGLVRLPGPITIVAVPEQRLLRVSTESLPSFALLEATHGEQRVAKIADERGRVTIDLREVAGAPIFLRMVDRAGRHTHLVTFSAPDH